MFTECLNCLVNKTIFQDPVLNGIKFRLKPTIEKYNYLTKISSKILPITQHTSVMNTATATFWWLFLQLIAFRFDNKVFDVSMRNSVCDFNGEKHPDPGALYTILYHSTIKVFYRLHDETSSLFVSRLVGITTQRHLSLPVLL